MTRIPTLLATVVWLGATPVRAQWKYPVTPTSDAADVLHGQRYQDPYRPLENLADPKIQAWFKSQARLTDDVLARIPGRDALIKLWTDLDRRTPPKYGDVQVEAGRVFYRKTLPGESVGRIYVREAWNAPEQLVFDPTRYRQGETFAVTDFAPSFDGRRLLLALAAKGAEWSELRVLDVDSRQLLPDSIYPSRGGAWIPDGSGFTYDSGDVTDTRSNEIQLNRKARLHRIGSPVSADRDLLSSSSTPELGIAPREIPLIYVDEVAPDRLLGAIRTVQPERRIYTAPVSELGQPRIAWKRVAQPDDKVVRGMAVSGEWVYAITYTGAPRYKLVRTRIDRPDWKSAETVVAEAQDILTRLDQSKDVVWLQYTNGIEGRVVRHDLRTGKSEEVKLPTGGAVSISCPDAKSNLCLARVSSWIQPEVLYEMDGDSGSVRKSPLSSDTEYPELAGAMVEEVEIPGQDGTSIQLSIIRPKDMPMDGSMPCILEGYGAYGISLTPAFNIRSSVVGLGVVLAVAHVRGGGERGEAWYRAGYKSTKPNTWKDFISAAEYLVKKGYTSPKHLAGRGTSAGGILITRAITERPDLFAAAVVNVGMANALRAEASPNGPVNAPEFGTVQDPAEARALAEMDGLLHVQPGVRYPAVLGVAGWNDPRVTPWQPAKFVAAVQQASNSGRPALLQVNYDNGHFTEDKSVTYRNFANQATFELWEAGHAKFQPRGPPVATPAKSKQPVPVSK